MHNYLRNSTLQVALLSSFFGLPVAAALADEKPAAGETADRLNKIERNVDDLKEKLKSIDESLKSLKDTDTLKPLRDDVAKLKTDVASLQENGSKTVEVKKPISEEPKPPDPKGLDLAERVRRLEQAVENMPLTVQAHSRDLTRVIQDVQQLQRDVGNLKQEFERARLRISRYPASTEENPATMGKIQLVNAWMTPMSVVVDGLAYRLAPGETRFINRPAGPFTYEVLGLQPVPLSRNVTAGETFTIRIAPQ